ncbi:precorrin-6y C5,15-methyltransferase (decarboxylating) subunit CbiE [Pyrobaculum sp.]|uniref:precorrin-6y C5,15-methyltransferase (decarboxylating) subunit CbiE n=1 Tax=Pyrobaculum sp. TaxID=2004705 RepID=UPI003D09B619
MLYVVGVGPGDPEYITLKALRTLERCAVVAGWRSVVERLPLDGKEVVYLTYQNQEAELRRLAEASLGRDVCIAVHGDPAVSDWELMRRIRSLGVPYEVVSGVSFLNVALARAGLDAAHVVLISQHASEPQEIAECGDRALVIVTPPDPQGRRRLAERLRRYSERGCAIYLMEDLTLPTERVFLAVPDDVTKAGALSAVVVNCSHGIPKSPTSETRGALH